MDDKAVGLTQLGKTQRKTDLLCVILKVMSFCLKFSVLMKLPYYYSVPLYY